MTSTNASALADEKQATHRSNDVSATTRHSSFSSKQKWVTVILVAYAAWFSTLSSVIYYPAIPSLSTSLDRSIADINLTVTTYMAVATIAPALVGDAADIIGRRPIYIATIGVYAITCMAIALVKTYKALLGLRLLQALAISGTFSTAYGVVADIASPAERGTFASIVSFSISTAPTIGPCLGGVLVYAGGWPWIFWFTGIASTIALLALFFFLPETSRNVAGDGSRPVPWLNRRPDLALLVRRQHRTQCSSGTERPVTYQRRIPNPLKSLYILLRPDNAIILLAGGLLYVVYTCLVASLASICKPKYNLTDWEGGLIYIPFGMGGVVSTFMSGPILDHSWRRHRIARGLSTDKAVGDDLKTFAVEKARLSAIWIPLISTTVATIGYGWALQSRQHLALPLTLQFIIGLVMQLEFTAYNTLLVDVNHTSPAAAQASSNIVRCSLAAIFIAFLQQIIDTIDVGWTFTIMGGLCVASLALFVVDYAVGQGLRTRYTKQEPT